MKGLKKGFSLLELIVVLTVIGIIGTLGYQKFTEVTMNAKSVQLGNQLAKIEAGMNDYYADLGTYPLNVKWLVETKMDDSANNYDALGLKLNGGEDEDVPHYWSGPYIKDMKTREDATNGLTIQAVFGDKIHVCAKVTGGSVDADGKVSGASVINKCSSDVMDEDSKINVFLIEGIDAEAVKFLFKAINGREMNDDDQTIGNAWAVATENGNRGDKLGVPAREHFGATTPFVIYRYTSDIQNEN